MRDLRRTRNIDPAEPRTTLAVSVLCLGGITVALSQTIVIPAQPRLPTLLSTSPSNAAWVITVTLLAGAISMPIMGRVADLVGKRLVLAALAFVMALGSLLCALSDTFAPMVAGRALQGMSLGFISVGISMIRDFTPPEKAPTAVATMSATLGIGGAIALPLAAWVMEVGDWHILFVVSAAMALAVGVLVLLVVPRAGGGRPGRLDLRGAFVLGVGLALLLLGVSKGSDWGWGSPMQLACSIGGVVVLALWMVLQLRTPDPLIDLRTSASRPVLLTNLASLLIGFGLMANAIVIPRLMQTPAGTGYGLGLGLMATAVWMAPGGLVTFLCAPISGRLLGSKGPRISLIVGSALFSVGYVLCIFLMGAPWTLALAMCVSSAGMGIGYAAMPYLILDSVPPAQAAAAVGFNGLMRSIGTTSAAAVLGVILTGNTTLLDGADVPTLRSFHACFLLGAVAAGLGGLLVAWVRPPVAAREGPAAPAPDQPGGMLPAPAVQA